MSRSVLVKSSFIYVLSFNSLSLRLFFIIFTLSSMLLSSTKHTFSDSFLAPLTLFYFFIYLFHILPFAFFKNFFRNIPFLFLFISSVIIRVCNTIHLKLICCISTDMRCLFDLISYKAC
ncbi:unnamed protein product [Acanthoscelides obtectus]|uniref:Uncharacterized protein n=1 Tax=Acanthoscelides obtectus TaxID=200917 RepID=A0A9P0KI82_ACAOB|nr:unnamed protein product [Acanthoscelides obtectus]CAH1998432.1 unnamed protein product [Acanthoscelides obtectus]CAK1680271.1 hypothetical protein AOBTE_LOCUS32556 [Acanthoscelides obtectus]CAK1680343.1 hypothetical protein AOBTE_LOCUS32587 [Acanthoscelides obtectus]